MCYPVFHATLIILQNKKIHLPLLPRFAYFLVLLLGFHLLIIFCLIAGCFSKGYFLIIFLTTLKSKCFI